MTAYYNEHDPFAAAWLRELIRDGLIAPGDVDERSIEDVTPNDVAPYTQCHFFAGIGGWSYALRLAGWPDGQPVWTGSPPCQPFSSAGKGAGIADERHLWPAFFWLISQCKPGTIFGEQVSSKKGLAWWDVVAADLEAAGYGCGAFDLCAAGAGAFHLRQRLYFVANADQQQWNWRGPSRAQWHPEFTNSGSPCGRSGVCSVAISNGSERRPPTIAQCDIKRKATERGEGTNQSGECSGFGVMAHTNCPNGKQLERSGVRPGETAGEWSFREFNRPGDPGELWRSAEWIFCKDNKARPVKPGIFPLVNGVSGQVAAGSAIQEPAATLSPEEKEKKVNRVGTLRGAGNAIVPQVAAEFIGAYLDIFFAIGVR